MNELVKTSNDRENNSESEGQYLTFRLGEKMFATGILAIKEIIQYGNVTTVPMMPEFLRGVINLRGHVVPIIDLQARFGEACSEVTKRTCFVIIEIPAEDGYQELGIVVDAVSEVIGIPDTEIERPPSFGANIRSDFISGMGKVGVDFVVILNMNNVLSVSELVELSDVNRVPV